MRVRFTDEDIDKLLKEPKQFPSGLNRGPQLRHARGHDRQEVDVVGAQGNEFHIIIRRSQFNPLDFSVILAHKVPMSNELFRLRRYNGRSHWHTNPLEGQTFYDFHIHQATERYQVLGAKEEHYAEPTGKYADLEGALTRMLSECGFTGGSPQPRLF